MKTLALAFAVAALAVLTGCATAIPNGLVYTGVQLPVSNSDGSTSFTKTGESASKSVLGLVTWGDGSIQKAASNGSITKVRTVDYKAMNVLGIYGKYTTKVYGD